MPYNITDPIRNKPGTQHALFQTTGSFQGFGRAAFAPWLASLVTMLLLWTLRGALRRRRHTLAFAKFAEANGCGQTRRQLPRIFMASLRNKLRLLTYREGDLFDELLASKYRIYGDTHAFYDSDRLPTVIHTIDPANAHAMLSSGSRDYSGPKARKSFLYPLAQRSVLVSEGAEWAHHRKLASRGIARGAKHTGHLESNMRTLIGAIGPAKDDEGWTEEVDLLDLFYRFTLDVSAQHLFGVSSHSQASAMSDRESTAIVQDSVSRKSRSATMTLDEAYDTVSSYVARRSRLGSKCWMIDSFKVTAS